MSSSDDSSKIDLLDSTAQLKKKLKMAFCEPGNIEDNGVLAFVKHVLFSVRQSQEFVVERKEEFGGNQVYTKYEDIEADFAKEALHPGDLKAAVIRDLDKLLQPIRVEFESSDNKKLVAEAYPVEKKKKGPPAAKSSGDSDSMSPNRLDLRIGRISSVEKHPNAVHLVVHKVDLGEENPRTVVSGLSTHVLEENLIDRLGVFLCNLKPQKVKGIESQAMLLYASQEENKVELLDSPKGSKVGDKVKFDGAESCVPDEKLNPKKKVWESLQVDIKTNSHGEVFWRDCAMKSEHGNVIAPSFKGVPVKS